MNPIYTQTTIRAGIHDFKTNISKYIQLLDSGRFEQLILTSRGQVIGGFYTFEGARQRARLIEAGIITGPSSGSDQGGHDA